MNSIYRANDITDLRSPNKIGVYKQLFWLEEHAGMIISFFSQACILYQYSIVDQVITPPQKHHQRKVDLLFLETSH